MTGVQPVPMQTRYDFKARKKAFLVRCKALDDPEWENTVLHSESLIQRFLDEDIQKGDAIRVGISLSQLVHGHYPSSLLAYGRSDGQDAQGIWQQLRLLELAVNLTVQQYREENETVYDGCVPGLHEWLALYGWAWGVGNEDLADAIAALLHNYVVSNNLRSELQESHLVEWLAPLMAAQLTGSWPAVEDVTDAMGPFRWLMDGIADPVLWPEALMMYCDFRLGRSERYTYPDSKRRTIDVHPMSIFENHSFSVVNRPGFRGGCLV